jgi:hypothetical protein
MRTWTVTSFSAEDVAKEKASIVRSGAYLYFLPAGHGGRPCARGGCLFCSPNTGGERGGHRQPWRSRYRALSCDALVVSPRVCSSARPPLLCRQAPRQHPAIVAAAVRRVSRFHLARDPPKWPVSTRARLPPRCPQEAARPRSTPFIATRRRCRKLPRAPASRPTLL